MNRGQLRYPASINWGNPITRKLEMCVISLRGQVFDLISKQFHSSGDYPEFDVHESGIRCYAWKGANSGIQRVKFTSGPFTVATFMRITNFTDLNYGSYLSTEGAGNVGWIVGAYGVAGGRYRFVVNGSTLQTTNPARSNGDHSVVGISNGTSSRALWVDGKQVVTSTSNLNCLDNVTTGLLSQYGATEVGGIYIGYAWSRRLLDFELRKLAYCPFGILNLSHQRLRYGVVKPATVSSVNFRKTLTPLGTGVGKRQVLGAI